MTTFTMDIELLKAMDVYNSTSPETNFTITDATLLCLIKHIKNNLYFSNKELSELLICNPSTVQRSIDKLVAANFVIKEKTYINAAPKRHLIYNTETVDQFIISMNLIKAESEWDG